MALSIKARRTLTFRTNRLLGIAIGFLHLMSATVFGDLPANQIGQACPVNGLEECVYGNGDRLVECRNRVWTVIQTCGANSTCLGNVRHHITGALEKRCVDECAYGPGPGRRGECPGKQEGYACPATIDDLARDIHKWCYKAGDTNSYDHKGICFREVSLSVSNSTFERRFPGGQQCCYTVPQGRPLSEGYDNCTGTYDLTSPFTYSSTNRDPPDVTLQDIANQQSLADAACPALPDAAAACVHCRRDVVPFCAEHCQTRNNNVAWWAPAAYSGCRGPIHQGQPKCSGVCAAWQHKPNDSWSGLGGSNTCGCGFASITCTGSLAPPNAWGPPAPSGQPNVRRNTTYYPACACGGLNEPCCERTPGGITRPCRRNLECNRTTNRCIQNLPPPQQIPGGPAIPGCGARDLYYICGLSFNRQFEACYSCRQGRWNHEFNCDDPAEPDCYMANNRGSCGCEPIGGGQLDAPPFPEDEPLDGEPLEDVMSIEPTPEYEEELLGTPPSF